MGISVLAAFLFTLICNIERESYPHLVDDYIPIDDLPVEEARLVRADVSDSITGFNVTTVNQFEKQSDTDWSWMDEALRDIAYYLRQHKFNEFDRRYETNKTDGGYYKAFPQPPLRTLHWEVQKYCEGSFINCVRYLWGVIKRTDLKRGDDSGVIMLEQHWEFPQDEEKIIAVDLQCRLLKKMQEELVNPFQGPLERFQWRTTASYYMCWYTMNQTPNLRHLNEKCDNYAYCLDSKYLPRNHDFRANDEIPFSCATYSFCPDPCCDLRCAHTVTSCRKSNNNPCYFNLDTLRTCTFNPGENINFEDMILNYWNVSCNCLEQGYKYSSKYGICVDIDECTSPNICDTQKGYACLNTPGSYKCICKSGYIWHYHRKVCVKSNLVNYVREIVSENINAPEKSMSIRSFFKNLLNFNSTGILKANALLIFAMIFSILKLVYLWL